MAGKKSPRYSEEFKKTIVNLHQNGKSYAEIEQEYGVSHSALTSLDNQILFIFNSSFNYFTNNRP